LGKAWQSIYGSSRTHVWQKHYSFTPVPDAALFRPVGMLQCVGLQVTRISFDTLFGENFRRRQLM
jgi:hypothetical protein